MTTTPRALPDNTIDETVDDTGQQRAILIAVCVSLMAVVASVTGLNVAQPDLAVEFNASQGTVLWFINSYTVTLAALLLPLGAVGDRWGRKPVLLAGLAVFGLASAAAGLAGSATVMLASRVLSGIGAAMIMPVTLAVITSGFPVEERSRAIGVWTAVAGGGGILGMYLSATLVDFASWRWLFLLPVALVGVAAWLTVRSVPNSHEVSADRFDLGGSLAAVVAVVGLIMALHDGPAHGWGSPRALVFAGLGLAGAATFVAWERRQRTPLLDVGVFRDARLATGSAALLGVFGVQAGVFVVLFPYFQAVVGWSGLRATVALMPMALLMMVASGLAPRASGRLGIRWTIAAGIAISTVGLATLALVVDVGTGYAALLPGMLAMGLGMGLAMTPSTEAITTALPRERQGVASALNDVTREFGTALGIALLGAVLAAGYTGAIDGQLAGVPAQLADAAREGIGTAMAAAAGSGAHAEVIVGEAQAAFIAGWRQSMWAGVVIMAVLLALVVARGPREDHPA